MARETVGVWSIPAAVAMAMVLAQIVYPLTAGTARDRVTTAVVVLSAATAVSHAWVTRGGWFALGFLAIVSGIASVAEITGIATGFPFGCYHYASGRLGPEVAGVPWVVPPAWAGGIYPVWVVARLLAPGAAGRTALTAAGAVGWDLFLDPQMVADGQWTWCSAQPGLPGLSHIPYTNYLGWFVLAGLLAVPLSLLDRRFPGGSGQVAVPVAVFLWTWLGSVLAHAAFLHLPASAGYGGAGLGILAIPLLIRLLRPPRGSRGDQEVPAR